MSEGYTTAAKMAAELLGDPGVEDEINAELARTREIDKLVVERCKAGLSVQDVAERMGVTASFVQAVEEGHVDDEALPLAIKLYSHAVRRGKEGG